MRTWDKTTRALELLAEAQWPVDEGGLPALERFAALVEEWNARAGLMSRGEGAHLDEHIADSLSLAPYAGPLLDSGAVWADVGSGGGFPALPIAVALGNPPVLLVERNQKKVGFLRMAAAKLGLDQVALLAGSFPACVQGQRVGLVTARAVEKPEQVIPAIGSVLDAAGEYLCQRSGALVGWEAMFHVEQVADAFDAAGLRRGKLYRLRRR